MTTELKRAEMNMGLFLATPHGIHTLCILHPLDAQARSELRSKRSFVNVTAASVGWMRYGATHLLS